MLAHGASRGLGVLKIGAAKRRKRVLLDHNSLPLTGLLARAQRSPRLTPWAYFLRHFVADDSSPVVPILICAPFATLFLSSAAAGLH